MLDIFYLKMGVANSIQDSALSIFFFQHIPKFSITDYVVLIPSFTRFSREMLNVDYIRKLWNCRKNTRYTVMAPNSHVMDAALSFGTFRVWLSAVIGRNVAQSCHI